MCIGCLKFESQNFYLLIVCMLILVMQHIINWNYKWYLVFSIFHSLCSFYCAKISEKGTIQCLDFHRIFQVQFHHVVDTMVVFNLIQQMLLFYSYVHILKWKYFEFEIFFTLFHLKTPIKRITREKALKQLSHPFLIRKSRCIRKQNEI